VIHRNADDLASQPLGTAGDRVGCGVIRSNRSAQAEWGYDLDHIRPIQWGVSLQSHRRVWALGVRRMAWTKPGNSLLVSVFVC